MTHRERVIGTLTCRSVDRAPFPMWLGFAPWGQTYERWKQESGIADLDVYRYFGFEPFFQAPGLDYGPCPPCEAKVVEETPEFIISTDFRGVTMRNRRDGHSMPDFIRHPIATAADWQRYKCEHLQPRIEQRTADVDRFVEAMAQVDAPVQVGAPPWGVFGTARDMMGSEELLLAFYDAPDLVKDIMATFTELWIAIYEAVARRVQIDHIHIWEDMSGKQGSLISMAMIDEFMMPHYDRISAFARDNGVAVISVDSDGLVDELVPKMMKHGVNAFFPFEVQAGNDILDYRRRYPSLGIIGGLDKRVLAKGKPEIHAELDKAEKMLAAGGYVVGFDHLIPPDAGWENFKYAIEHLRRMVGL